jgi:hypothetical protein
MDWLPLHHHTPSLQVKYYKPLIKMEGQQTMWGGGISPGALYVAGTLMIGLPNYNLDGVIV